MKKYLFLVFPLLSLSCTGSPPVIQNIDWMFLYTQDLAKGGEFEELNLFAQLEDEDGFEDILEFTVFQDDEGWSWKLDQEEWVSLSEDGEDWIGANGLTKEGEIPEGDYRLLIVDRSGQRSERSFFLDRPPAEQKPLKYPSAYVSGDTIQIKGEGYHPLILWFYDETGDFLTEYYTSEGIFPIRAILGNEESQIARWFMIYHQDEQGGYGVKSGPFLMDGAAP